MAKKSLRAKQQRKQNSPQENIQDVNFVEDHTAT